MAAPGGHYQLTSQMSAPAAYANYPPPPQMSPQQSQTMVQQPKEVNVALFCRAGQEAVHDIVAKATDLFQQMFRLQLPNASSAQLFQERRLKIDELQRQILQLFQKLRVIYTKIDEISMLIPEPPEELLIPLVGHEMEQTSMNNDVYRFVAEEHREVVEQVRLKNQEIKDIIDQIRSIIWEINTMITMRKTLTPAVL